MLGDMLCAVPALRALRHMCPQAEIALIGLPWARAFAARFPKYIDSFIEFPGFPGLPERDWRAAETVEFIRDMQSQKADWIVQLHGDGTIINPLMMLFAASRAAGYYLPDAYCPDAATFLPYPADEPEVRRHLRLMEFLGATDLDEDLEFTITDEDHIPLAALTGGDEWFHQPYVCIHPGARFESRRWLPRCFAEVADRIAREGFRIVITGSSSEAPLAEAIRREMHSMALDLTGQTSLGMLAALLEGSRLLLTNDTGISHLAAALKVQSVVLVLGSDANRWAPLDGGAASSCVGAGSLPSVRACDLPDRLRLCE